MRIAAAAALLLVAACATQHAANPEVVIEQLSNVASAARHVTGPITLRYIVRVRNVASEPVTLKRLELNSVGTGAYNLAPLARALDMTIAPGSETSVEMVGSGQVVDWSVIGANGPVTLRAVLHLTAASGRWQTVLIQPVRSSTSAD